MSEERSQMIEVSIYLWYNHLRNCRSWYPCESVCCQHFAFHRTQKNIADSHLVWKSNPIRLGKWL